MRKIINKKSFILLITFILIALISVVIGLCIKKEKFRDVVYYKGKPYVNLEYNMDIFTYGFNGNDYYEEDIIHPINNEKWDAVYFNGDLFIIEDQVEEAKEYYANDKNYEWFIVFDKDDTELSVPITITKKELKYLYSMDDMDRNETMTFEDIKQFASITKISKDKLVYSIISLAHYKDSWYWKTEIMDDNQEDNYEYIIKLPESLNKKIFELLDAL